jgi:hypothetical protein
MTRGARTRLEIEALMDKGIAFMVRDAAKRAKAGQSNHKEMLLIIGCAMRWVNLKRQLGIHAPESGAAIDELRKRLRHDVEGE